MNISNLGEFNLINRFSKQFLESLTKGTVGIGDDCAVIPQENRQSLLVTTDMLIENVHFIKNFISAEDLGHKSLAVNLSDIAAMGGIPKYAFLSLALPIDLEITWIDSFFNGFKKIADDFRVHLLGGDTAKSEKSISINVTLIGNIYTENIKLRSNAKHGDIICVTDCLGDSSAGLKSLLENKSIDSDIKYLVERHHHPNPHVNEGQWFATHSKVHAMMDISDGIDSDLKRIMERSSCGAIINLEQIPISDPLLKVSSRFSWNSHELATTGGEDYCLLLTIDPSALEEIQGAYKKEFKTPLYPIGKVTNQIGKLSYQLNGKPLTFQTKGFDHFAAKTNVKK